MLCCEVEYLFIERGKRNLRTTNPTGNLALLTKANLNLDLSVTQLMTHPTAIDQTLVFGTRFISIGWTPKTGK